MILALPDKSSNEDELLMPDLTPLLDVLFMVLIFFMLTSNSAHEVLQLDLPGAGVDQAETLESNQPLFLTIYAGEARWKVGEQVYDQWLEVESALIDARLNNPKVEIVVASDRDVPFERALQALSFLKKQGLPTAQVLMRDTSKTGD